MASCADPLLDDLEMIVAEAVDVARSHVLGARASGEVTGLVPTMGALHAGHVSLIEAAKKRCRFVAVSVFVNPTQFGPNEDYGSYPRTIESDAAACRQAGVDLLFVPSASAMYAPDCCTTVSITGVTDVLCGPLRPGHFDGVATVVAKLFGILPADVAFFGEKDFQQLVVIRQMVRDLNMGIEVVGCPTIREPDGLAMSSRNAYLSATERIQALSISRGLTSAVGMARAGTHDAAALVGCVRDTIQAAGPASIEYVEVVDAATLAPVAVVDRAARICVAVRIGGCRLIDNVAVDVFPAGS